MATKGRKGECKCGNTEWDEKDIDLEDCPLYHCAFVEWLEVFTSITTHSLSPSLILKMRENQKINSNESRAQNYSSNWLTSLRNWSTLVMKGRSPSRGQSLTWLLTVASNLLMLRGLMRQDLTSKLLVWIDARVLDETKRALYWKCKQWQVTLLN